ncbi:hypothetical protein Mal4_48470 [Maioricimonas rarisocia]|uniref:3-keto-alpha-glucoside-1,2-lyase/3-keto-2-hydroxy-glucal hydratase domain-containing protein n=1 Tax=Maioricimonas rarisocia TaxID=2528026 RepID=A0A517ZDE3_9PLAN|nr:DUF1080 domain-containing protein [Maioricimonas rarisocia]QDU40489.1 hypothetical protein Mal4_48470 [Maioricimonas rarisocia]
MNRRVIACSFGLLCLSLSIACLAAPAPGETYATPEQAAADPDFALQGEYTGDGVGLQVVALGNGEFSAVTFEGGLPGSGFTGEKADRSVTQVDRNGIKKLIADMSLNKVHRESETLGAEPPKGAVVLFDGTKESLDEHWKDGAKMTSDGLLIQGVTSTDTFRDFTAHVEFRLPYMPEARGQARGNSGLYLQGRYEIQMLDSFGLEGKDNECGGIYKAAPPAVNMCLPPLNWQTYDVEFTAARFDDSGKKVKNARVTVRHNGVVIHDDLEIPGATPGGPLSGKENAQPGPIFLQNHGNPVRYRNIWVVAN